MNIRDMQRGEIDTAVELATQAFSDYDYFTNFFPDAEERRKVQAAMMRREYRTNFSRTQYLVAAEKNIAYYRHRGFEVFDERTFTTPNGPMKSWSVKKAL